MPGSNGGMTALAPSEAGTAPAESSYSSTSVGYTISYVSVEIVHLGGFELARMEQLGNPPYL